MSVITINSSYPESDSTLYTSEPVCLDGPRNFRDLGGYPVMGKTTRKGVLYRSDSLASLSERDILWIKKHKIHHVIDLRSEVETKKSPDRLPKDIEYFAIPMSDRLPNLSGRENTSYRLSCLYHYLLDTQKKQFGKVMELISDKSDGGIVFHCTLGKDRTGIVAMLIMDLAGVEENHICRDYATSASNLAPRLETIRQYYHQLGWDVPESLLASPQSEIKETYRFLKSKWGGAWGYLKECGLENETLNHIKAILV